MPSCCAASNCTLQSGACNKAVCERYHNVWCVPKGTHSHRFFGQPPRMCLGGQEAGWMKVHGLGKPRPEAAKYASALCT